MKGFIILLRHGIAEDRTADKPDEERRLTDSGKRRMKQIATTLAQIFPEAEALYSSPLVRAVETAEAVAKAFGDELKIQTTDALKPGSDRQEFRKLLAGLKVQFAIFAGHEPVLTEIMLDLTSTRTDSEVELKKGGCYGLRVDDNSAHLEWMLPPRVLRRSS